MSCLYYAVRVATDPSIPANGGCYRSISMSPPAGWRCGQPGQSGIHTGMTNTKNTPWCQA